MCLLCCVSVSWLLLALTISLLVSVTTSEAFPMALAAQSQAQYGFAFTLAIQLRRAMLEADCLTHLQAGYSDDPPSPTQTRVCYETQLMSVRESF